MRFAPTTEQNEFAEAVRGLLEDTCTPADLRATWGGEVGAHTGLGAGDGRNRAAWEALVEMGVMGLMVPEADGGLGMTDDDLVGIIIECGYAGLPDPLAQSAGVAAAALSSLGVPEWPARIASGATVVAAFGPDPLMASVATADAVLAFGHDPVTGEGEQEVRLLAPGDLELEALESVDGSRCVARMRVEPGAGELLAEGADAVEAGAVAFDRAATLDSALLIGLARRMLEMTVEYVGERKQFGVAIGTFQAVKHHLADAGLAIEFAEPLVRNAAHLLSLQSQDVAERAVAVSMAKQRASEAAVLASEVTLQCHGAIGYTVEADLHLFMKRAWALAHADGDANWHLGRVRNHLLET